MKNSTFSICFFIKKSKLLKNGKAPLFMRITINGSRWETSLQVGVETDKWDSHKEKARGSDRNSILVNEIIDNARYLAEKIYLEITVRPGSRKIILQYLVNAVEPFLI
jgi:hypothetical protein